MRPATLYLVIAVLLAACDATIAIETSGPPEPGFLCPAALTSGEIVRDVEHGLVLLHPNGRRERILWPNGYSSRLVGTHAVLLDTNHKVAASEGDRVRLRGAALADGRWLVCPPSGIEVLSTRQGQ